MDAIEIADNLSLFINDIDELINQYGNQHFNYQKIFQYLTSPYAEKRDKTKYIIEMEYMEYYPRGNWRDDFLDKIIKLFDKYKKYHKLGLFKKKIMFYENTIIKITVNFVKPQ
jgi:hypothetical protein